MNEYYNYTILVVDDEETLRNTIIFDLKRKKFNVLAADCVLSALELIKVNKVHLIVSDIRMPGGDGVTLLEQIRAQGVSPPVFIFMTGFADVSEEECRKKGAKEIVSKPFDRKVLMSSIFESLGISTSAPAKVA